MTTISAEELPQSDTYFLLDVRNMNEYTDGYIPGAHQLAVSRVVWHDDELPRDQPIVTYCASGRRAAVGSSALRRKGYHVIELDGDFHTWANIEGNMPAYAQV